MSGPEPGGPGTAERRSVAGPAQQDVELVGPDLRVSGRISLGRFSNLADLVNHNRSVFVLHGARLLDRGGQPTDVELEELVVNQDDVTFIGHQSEEAARPAGGESLDRPVRMVVIFMPGHAVTGGMHVVRDTTLVNFVEATDPRFVILTDAVVSPLDHLGAVSRFDRLLVNRTQISAIAETEHGSELIAAAVGAAPGPGTPDGRNHHRPHRAAHAEEDGQ
jgi:hypothetical protein